MAELIPHLHRFAEDCDPGCPRWARPLQHHPAPRPRPRFTIRRISVGAKTNYPWCVYDLERPSYIGRFATFPAALTAAHPFEAVPKRYVLPITPELVEDAGRIELGESFDQRLLDDWTEPTA